METLNDMADLDPTDKAKLWQKIEANYWASLKVARDRKDVALREHHKEQADPLKLELNELYAERIRLEARLREVNAECGKREERLAALGREADRKREGRAAKWAVQDAEQRAFFKRYRLYAETQQEAGKGGAIEPDNAMSRRSEETMQAVEDVLEEASRGFRGENGESAGPQSKMGARSGSPAPEERPQQDRSMTMRRNGDRAARVPFEEQQSTAKRALESHNVEKRLSEDHTSSAGRKDERMQKEAGQGDPEQGSTTSKATQNRPDDAQQTTSQSRTNRKSWTPLRDSSRTGSETRQNTAPGSATTAEARGHVQLRSAHPELPNASSQINQAESSRDATAADASVRRHDKADTTPRQAAPGAGSLPSAAPLKAPATPAKVVSGATPAIRVRDGNGALVGSLRPISLDNHWIRHIQQYRVRRDVVIRPGRKFTAENLEAIYEPSDAKGAKWLSMHIQAKGEIQGQPCHACLKQSVVFKGCTIIMGEDDFPKCGNCEWNRQGCQGASLEPQDLRVDAPRSDGKRVDDTDEKKALDQSPLKQARTTPVTSDRKASRGAPDPGEDYEESEQDDGADDDGLEELEDDDEEDGVAADIGITRATLVLRDDGSVFTHPPLMAGVPVVKISPQHPYWEDPWDGLKPYLEDTMENLKEKVNAAQRKSVAASARRAANCQLNRGILALEFLRDGECHPYQLVGKDWIDPGMANYTVIFRLAKVIVELRKYKLDVTPLQWIRQRLYEIVSAMEAKGRSFILSQALKVIYHDRKLVELREQNGASTVGRRPAGGKAARSSIASMASRGGITPRGSKRKRSDDSPKPSPQGGRAKKKTRGVEDDVDSESDHDIYSTRGSTPDDLKYDGYTSSDSLCHDKLVAEEWRVEQVKNSLAATNSTVTQYWCWVDDTTLEHQVLKELQPVEWALYKEQYEFNVRMAEVTGAEYSRDSRKVVLHTKRTPGLQREGDVMVLFKRERTKRRFLQFLRRKGKKVVARSFSTVEQTWDSLQSEELPGNESE